MIRDEAHTTGVKRPPAPALRVLRARAGELARTPRAVPRRHRYQVHQPAWRVAHGRREETDAGDLRDSVPGTKHRAR